MLMNGAFVHYICPTALQMSLRTGQRWVIMPNNEVVTDRVIHLHAAAATAALSAQRGRHAATVFASI